MEELIFDLQRFATNHKPNVLVNGTDSNDKISNYPEGFSGGAYNVTINARGGNDSIFNVGNEVLIDAGAGYDTIENNFGSYDDGWGNNVTILGGDGNDSIKNWRGANVSIDGGDGNDTILSGVDATANYCTISGGTGNDRISIKSGRNNTYLYTKGDGNDTIDGFKADSTLSISGSSYSTAESDRDVIVYVGDGSILLTWAATLPSINIVEAVSWKLSGTTATYGTSTNAQITIKGVKALDGISLSGTTVNIAANSLNQSNVTISNGYTLALQGVAAPDYTAAHWSGTTYKSASNTAGYSLANDKKSIVYTAAVAETDLFTINGVQNTNGISISGTTVTIPKAALDQSAVTISNNNYTLALGNDVPISQTTAAGWTLNGTNATYKNAAVSAGYQLANNQISYVEASGGESVTVSGVKSLDGLSISGKVVTVKGDALNPSNVTISDGYTLALQGVAAPDYTAAHWSGTTYKSASNTAGYSLSDNQIVYTAAKAETDLFTISGITNTNGISITGTTVTVPLSALNQGTVTITGGYTLKLADDVTTPQPTAAHWEYSGNVATYKNNFTSAGYSIVNNQIVYNEASGGEILTAVSGVNSKEGLTLSGSTVTISAASLNQNTVTVSNGYTLALGNDVSTPQPKAAHWEHSGKVATYKNNSVSAGYQLENNQIVYKSASGGETLAIVNGVKSLDGLTLEGSTVKVAASALNQENVTISDGYTLALGNAVPTPQSTAAHWEHSGKVATYKNNSVSAGYQLENNQIVYKSASGGETLTTVSGVKSTNGLNISGSTVTVSAAALNQNTVTVSNGYTLALADDVQKSITTEASWTLNGNIATYKKSSTSAGYSVVNNQIVYNKASGGATLVTVNGVKSTNGLTPDGKTIKVSASALNKGTVTVSKGYSLILDDDVPISITTAAGWTLKGTTATYKNSSTTAGYKLLGGNQIVYNEASGGKTLATVSGVKSKDGLSLNDNVITVKASALNKKKVTISGNGYTLKLDDDVTKSITEKAAWNLSGSTATYKSSSKTTGYTLAGNGKSISYVKATKATNATIKGAKSKSGLSVSGNKITLKNSALKNKVTVSGGYEFNFASNYKKATITGSKNADAITTNGNNLSIAGGKGNDTLKVLGSATTVTGGAGKDVFVCNAGNNVIADYASEDKISITGAAQISTSGKDLIFTVGSGKITVKGGKDKKITYTDNSGENIYDSGVKTNGAAVNLLDNYSKNSYTIANGEQIKTVDGSAVQLDLKITGNEWMNSIVGGKGNDTLTGGGSNDTLTGGKGSDVFVYSDGDGNDVITDYNSDDRIKITKGTATVEKKGKDVIFTVGDGKITVKGAADKVVSYIDANGKTNYYPKPTSDSIIINGNTVTILEEYKSNTFDVVGKVKNGGNKIKNIDASLVSHNLKIVGNSQANVILGGFGDDTITGGKNNDTLQGSDGADTFVYANGDGKDFIIDYDEDDTIKITKGKVKVATKGSDVVFTVGGGKITVKDAASKTVTYIAGGKKKTYGSSASLIVDDNNYELTPNLSSLVQSKSADCSFVNISTKLSKENNLIAYSGKK